MCKYLGYSIDALTWVITDNFVWNKEKLSPYSWVIYKLIKLSNDFHFMNSYWQIHTLLPFYYTKKLKGCDDNKQTPDDSTYL